MKISFRKSISSILIPVIILAGLFYLTYSSSTVPLTGSTKDPFANEGIFVHAKAYTSKESMRYLHRDLTLNGIQPVQVTIQNNTDKIYFVSDSGIKTPHASAKRVSFSILKSAIPRSIALKIAGFFFWPFIIPSAIDTIVTARCHSKIMHEYSIKGFKEAGEPLMPYSTLNRVVFIPKNHSASKLDLVLFEKETSRLIPMHTSIG